MDNILNLLGLAKKAGKLALGEEPVGAAARSGACKLMLLASDAAGNTVRRSEHFAQYGTIPRLTLPYSKEELGQITGRTSVALLAVTEIGFAGTIAQKLAAACEEAAYQETAALLAQKASRAKARRAEQKTHEKKRRKGQLKK
jgi:ribosomal protein L7Ae-like RNA K-turn-binding protein